MEKKNIGIFYGLIHIHVCVAWARVLRNDPCVSLKIATGALQAQRRGLRRYRPARRGRGVRLSSGCAPASCASLKAAGRTFSGWLRGARVDGAGDGRAVTALQLGRYLYCGGRWSASCAARGGRGRCFYDGDFWGHFCTWHGRAGSSVVTVSCLCNSIRQIGCMALAIRLWLSSCVCVAAVRRDADDN